MVKKKQKRPQAKKAQEMSIGTIVVIVLALVVLVVLIYGFTVGWSNLFGQVTTFSGGKVNVQSVVQSCQVACSTSSTFDYCRRTREVVFDTTGTKNPDNDKDFTCSQLIGKSVGLESCGNVDCSSFYEDGYSCKGNWRGIWRDNCQVPTQLNVLSAVKGANIISSIEVSQQSQTIAQECCVVKAQTTCGVIGGESKDSCDLNIELDATDIVSDVASGKKCCVPAFQ